MRDSDFIAESCSTVIDYLLYKRGPSSNMVENKTVNILGVCFNNDIFQLMASHDKGNMVARPIIVIRRIPVLKI